jgi:hypothetical protein
MGFDIVASGRQFMVNEFISLLRPCDEAACAGLTKALNEDTINDLDLESLCTRIAEKKERSSVILEILTDLCSDEDVIRYRQEVFRDILASEKLRKLLSDMLCRLEGLSMLTKEAMIPEESNLWKYFSRFRELDAFVKCILDIKHDLQEMTLDSRGLRNFRDIVVRTSEDPDFKALQATLSNLDIEIDEIQSITIGINLDTSLDPVEATLVSVNKTRFRENSWLLNMFAAKNIDASDMGFMSRLHGLSQDKRHPVMHHLYKDIENLLKPVVKDMTVSLRKFSNMHGGFLLKLIPEITFYLSFAQVHIQLSEAGMPMCIPDIAGIGERRLHVKDIFNINHALQLMNKQKDPSKEIVLNDVNFDENGRIMILTGPNRGGKTVYTEAVGLVQVLMQAGVSVPGTYARISPADGVYTHFPADENKTVELGRLGEEAKRFSSICKEATSCSLILLNESFASTSFTEGLYIAQDVVRSLKYLETRAIFNTHMHELAACADEINQQVPERQQSAEYRDRYRGREAVVSHRARPAPWQELCQGNRSEPWHLF